MNAKQFERDFEKESAALLRKTAAMDAREIERVYEALNGTDPRAAVQTLAEQALRNCAAQGQDAPAQLRAAYEETAGTASPYAAGASLPAPHAQTYRPQPVALASVIREAQAEVEAVAVTLQHACSEYVRCAEMFEIEPDPIPHIHGPHEAMTSRFRIMGWLSTVAGVLGAFWLAFTAFGGLAAGAVAAMAVFVMMEFMVKVVLGAVLEPRTFLARSRALYGLCLGLLMLGCLAVLAGRSATGDWAARFLEYSPLAWCAIEVSLLVLGAWAFLGERRFGWSGTIVRHYCALRERQQALLLRIEYLRLQHEGTARSSGFGQPCEVYAGAVGFVYEGIIKGPDEGYARGRSGAPDADRRRAGIGVFPPSWAAMYQRVAQEPASAVTRFMQSISRHSLALVDFRLAWWSRIMAFLTFVTIVTLEWSVVSRALQFLSGGGRPTDFSVLSGGALASGLDLGVNSSGGITDWTSPDHNGTLIMRYPAGQAWGAMFITAGAAVPSPRPGVDLSTYQTLLIEMRGDAGETIHIGIKDATQPDDGRELRIPLQISGTWRTYTIPLKSFTGIDLKKIYVLAEFLFEGAQAKTVEVRSVKFMRADAHPP